MKLALLSVCTEPAVTAECDDSTLLALLTVLRTEPPPNRTPPTLLCVISCKHTDAVRITINSMSVMVMIRFKNYGRFQRATADKINIVCKANEQQLFTVVMFTTYFALHMPSFFILCIPDKIT